MSDSINSQISNIHGSVQAGGGDLNVQNVYNYYGKEAASRRRSSHTQSSDELRLLRQRFVYPHNFKKARDTLRSSRTVFLDGPPGSGRIAAAKILLLENAPDVRKLDALVADDAGKPLVDLAHVGDGHHIWLDLTTVDRSRWLEIPAELSSLRTVVRERAANLVVILPHENTDFDRELNQFRVEIEPPPVEEVLRRHLRVAGLTDQPEYLEYPAPINANTSLYETARFAELITLAWEKADRRGDFSEWWNAAAAVVSVTTSGQEISVARLLAKARKPRQRALLLATAMLHGARPTSIYRASDSLLRVVAHPPDKRPVLAQADLKKRFADIEAELHPSGRVQFKELGYDSAVRKHFWTYRPDLHRHLKEWVGETAESGEFTEAECDEFVKRFTQLCLADHDPSQLTSLVGEWTKESSDQHRKTAATLVLRHGLRDERHAGFFRRQIYMWSRTTLPEALADVLVQTCSEEMAVTHPGQAVVRLHHMARHEQGRRHAREALITLVRRDHGLHRQLLGRVTSSSSEIDAELFLELVDPDALTDVEMRDHALISESTVMDQLIRGWKNAFARLPDDIWKIRASEWLRCSADQQRHGNELLYVLVKASTLDNGVLACLYDIAWRELHSSVSDLLLAEIESVRDKNGTWGRPS